MALVLVSCAGDSDLAKRLYDFLVAAYPASKDVISLDADEITIQNEKPRVKNKEIRQSLAEFQAANPDLEGYTIMEFEDTFTIGIQRKLDELTISCELCGSLFGSEEELDIHRRIHWLVPRF
jgi:hypothetical protein